MFILTGPNKQARNKISIRLDIPISDGLAAVGALGKNMDAQRQVDGRKVTDKESEASANYARRARELRYAWVHQSYYAARPVHVSP